MVVNADGLLVGDDNWRKRRGSETDSFLHRILKNNFQASYASASSIFQ